MRNGDTVIHPPSLEPRWFGWVDDMHDWCISRQLWWGHRIPIWHGPDGEKVCVGPDETPPEGWEQDPDVLDTWFSSALWPFSTMGWPDHTPELEKFYPTSVLVTGYDILFFWVARMMMFGTFVGDDDAITLDGARGPQVPFQNVFLHGLIRDEFGRKMSKSKGNGIDPLDWVEMFGADALRFTLARGASPGGDLSIGEDHARASRNFATKLFNATRFALMNGAAPAPLPDATSSPTPTAGSSAGWKRFAPKWIRRSTATSSAGPARRSTTSPGTSSATGTSSWPRCSWPTGRRAHHRGAGRGARHAAASCCTR